MDTMPQSAHMVVNPIIVYSYGFLFYCMAVYQTSESMKALSKSFNQSDGA